MNGTRVLRAPGMTLTIDADGLHLRHPAWDFTVRATSGVVDLIQQARRPVSYDVLVAAAPGETVVRNLVDLGALVEVEDEQLEPEPRPPVPWNYWGFETWAFHTTAHRMKFLHDEQEIWFEKAGRTEPEPGRVRRWPDGPDDVALAPFRGTDAMARLFAARRTVREFAPRPVPLPDLARVVSETFRVRGVFHADYFGTVPAKSYPSAGARHEIDLYVIAFDVLGLPTGIHYYDDHRDALVQTGLTAEREAVEECLARQGIAAVSPVVLVTVCQSERIAWKYRSPRGYLDAYVNVGHALQNTILMAQSLGLGCWPTTAIDTAGLSALLNLSAAEFPTAVLGIGLPGDSG
jgi:SagB-type dehydrogenase family enzyme